MLLYLTTTDSRQGTGMEVQQLPQVAPSSVVLPSNLDREFRTQDQYGTTRITGILFIHHAILFCCVYQKFSSSRSSAILLVTTPSARV